MTSFTLSERSESKGFRLSTLLVVALLAAAGCTADDDDAGPENYFTWGVTTPLSGGARQETAVVTVDFDNVYVLGGFDESITVVDDVTRVGVTPAGVAPLPVPMHHANAGVADGKIWVLGFLTGLDFAADGRVFSYDPATDVWAEGPSMPLGTERGASGVAYDDEGDIYVVGGLRDSAAVADVSRFTPALTGTGGTWTGLTDLPAPRDHLVAGMIDGTVFAAGGRNTVITSHVPELLEFDPTGAGTWVARASMPTSRGGAAGAVWGGRLWVIGGEGNGDDPSGVFPQVEAYDPLLDKWESMPPMLTPRHGTGAGADSGEGNNGIIVPGGADQQAFGAVDTVEILYYHCPNDCPGE